MFKLLDKKILQFYANYFCLTGSITPPGGLVQHLSAASLLAYTKCMDVDEDSDRNLEL